MLVVLPLKEYHNLSVAAVNISEHIMGFTLNDDTQYNINKITRYICDRLSKYTIQYEDYISECSTVLHFVISDLMKFVPYRAFKIRSARLSSSLRFLIVKVEEC